MAGSKRGDLSVVKIGGRLLAGPIRARLAQELAHYARNRSVILVHGGGNEVTEFCESMNIRARFVNGRRFTDDRTMDAVELILCGKVNAEWVSALRLAGLNAVGMNGRMAGCLQARRVKGMGLVGSPVRARADFLKSLIQRGITPVFAPVASDSKKNALNVNADDFASFLAVRLKARQLIFFTDVPGILDGQSRTIPAISPGSSKSLVRDRTVTGGMVPKLQSAIHALGNGVKEIWILQGKLPLKHARGTIISRTKSNAKQPF